MDEVVQEVFEYQEWYNRGRDKKQVEILLIIEKMMENPPMRGDVALSDLRRAIEG
jgi:hypothetical protein